MLAALGVFGAALFLGDSMITPAISVLSAVEGLKVATPARAARRADHAVMLVGLFATSGSGRRRSELFGPVMVAWFVAIAVRSGPP